MLQSSTADAVPAVHAAEANDLPAGDTAGSSAGGAAASGPGATAAVAVGRAAAGAAAAGKAAAAPWAQVRACWWAAGQGMDMECARRGQYTELSDIDGYAACQAAASCDTKVGTRVGCSMMQVVLAG
jgi:hypothetical protein